VYFGQTFNIFRALRPFKAKHHITMQQAFAKMKQFIRIGAKFKQIFFNL
jgi:hypothetical protein